MRPQTRIDGKKQAAICECIQERATVLRKSGLISIERERERERDRQTGTDPERKGEEDEREKVRDLESGRGRVRGGTKEQVSEGEI